jgi:hypothetical protein
MTKRRSKGLTRKFVEGYASLEPVFKKKLVRTWLKSEGCNQDVCQEGSGTEPGCVQDVSIAGHEL